MRLCVEGPWDDNEWESWISQWHFICDSYITFTPTTPPISSISTTLYFDYCTLANSYCASLTVGLDQCSMSIMSFNSQMVSCYCQPRFLTMAYSCEYIGNMSCLQTGATLSSIWGYSFCSNFQSVIGTGLVSLYWHVQHIRAETYN